MHGRVFEWLFRTRRGAGWQPQVAGQAVNDWTGGTAPKCREQAQTCNPQNSLEHTSHVHRKMCR